jgi:F0F1-type ATP synthase epsilon subunit
MATLIELEIVTPKEHLVLNVEWIEITSPTGIFFVGPDHAPLVSLVKHKAPISYKEPGKNTASYEAENAFFSIHTNKALLLGT